MNIKVGSTICTEKWCVIIYTYQTASTIVRICWALKIDLSPSVCVPDSPMKDCSHPWQMVCDNVASPLQSHRKGWRSCSWRPGPDCWLYVSSTGVFCRAPHCSFSKLWENNGRERVNQVRREVGNEDVWGWDIIYCIEVQVYISE